MKEKIAFVFQEGFKGVEWNGEKLSLQTYAERKYWQARADEVLLDWQWEQARKRGFHNIGAECSTCQHSIRTERRFWQLVRQDAISNRELISLHVFGCSPTANEGIGRMSQRH